MGIRTKALKKLLATILTLVMSLSITPQVFALNMNVDTVPDYSTYAKLAAGYEHRLDLKADETVAVGEMNQLGQSIGMDRDDVFQAYLDAYNNPSTLGTTVKNNPSATEADVDVAVSALATATSVTNSTVNTVGVNADTGSKLSAGNSHTLVIKEDGTLWTWGNNYYGQLGDGTLTNTPIPEQVMSGVKSVAAGSVHSLALKEDGTLWAWGRNQYGQLGDGSTTNRATPVKVMSGVKAVAAAYFHTLAIKEDGTLWAWGSNYNGQLGDGSLIDRATPMQVMSGVKSAAVGGEHSLAIKEDGTLWAWGFNQYGQLGDGSITSRVTPVQVMNGVKSVAAGYAHTLAIKEDGTLWSWGGNGSGQLGNGTTTDRVNPVQVMSSVKSVAAGLIHTLAIKEDGTLWAWGRNDYGQLGDGSTTSKATPVQVMSGIKSVAAGYFHSIAAKEDGTQWAWGNNEFGQLGVGFSNYSSPPVEVRKSNTISGTISLPVGVTAPEGGIFGYVTVVPENGGDDYKKPFNIPAGGSSVSFIASVPVDDTISGYHVGYKFYTDLIYSEYVAKGYYSPEGTTDIDSATLVDVNAGTVSGINLTLIPGNTISGTVSLPPGVIAPEGGIIGYVYIESPIDDSYYVSYFNIPTGSNSISYSVTVPVDASKTGYRVGYLFYQLNYTGYVGEGYYSTLGTTNYNSATLVDVSAGNVTGVNLTVLTGNTISGTISLPVGVTAPEGGITGLVVVLPENSDNRYNGFFKIPAGSSSTSYTVTVPVDTSILGYRVGYRFYRDLNYSGYVGQGYYSSAGTTNYNSAALVDVRNGNVAGINLRLLTGNTISGTVSLPVGVTAPAGGIKGYVSVVAQDGSRGYTVYYIISEGSTSASYSATIPVDASITGYRVGYEFYIDRIYDGYVSQGYYSPEGTINYNSATFINVNEGNVSGLNLTVLTGNTISGTISLPVSMKAPFGGIAGNITLEPQNGGSNYTAYFIIPTGESTASYTAVVPRDVSITGYRVGYRFINNHLNNHGYLGNGYYSPGGITNYNSAALVNASGENITGVNLTLLTTAGIPDDYGNTSDLATEISVGTNIPGQIDYSGDSDYFKFISPSDGTYSIETQSNIDTYGYLYNSSGTEIAHNDSDNADGNFLIRSYLQAGQSYYVKVRHFSDGTGSYNLRVHRGNIMDYSATPLVQIGINPDDGGSAGIFVGLKDIRDAQGNVVPEAKLAGYQIEIDYDHNQTKIFDVVDEAHLENFTFDNATDPNQVRVADDVQQGTGNFTKLFFIPLAVTGTSTSSTNVNIKFISLSDTNLNQIMIPDVTVTLQRGKIFNEASPQSLSITDAVAGLQYLARIVDAGFELGKVNVINMASILTPETGATGIKPSVKDVVALMQYLVGLRDDSFQVVPGS